MSIKLEGTRGSHETIAFVDRKAELQSRIQHAVNFLEAHTIPFVIIGSSAIHQYGQDIRPNDLDILVLEPDIIDRLRCEVEIDTYNASESFQIDDSLTRLGTVFLHHGNLYIHGREKLYVQPRLSNERLESVHLWDAEQLRDLCLALIDAKPEKEKEFRILQYLEWDRQDSNRFQSHSLSDSPRDNMIDLDPRRMYYTIQSAIQDFQNLCERERVSIEIVSPNDTARVMSLVFRRILRRQVTIPYTLSGEMGTDIRKLDAYGRLYSRWKNFGRNIYFKDSR